MYRIENIINKRNETKYIILNQARSTYEKHGVISPETLEGGTYKYTWGDWQHYYYIELRKQQIPCHYFIEYVDKDYAIFVGNPIVNKSYFLEDLANAKAIPFKYRDAILINISEDFRFVPIDREMIYHLCNKVLSSLMMEFPITEDNILTLDEILVADYENALSQANLTYDIQPMTMFNKTILINILKKYKKGYKKTNYTGLF